MTALPTTARDRSGRSRMRKIGQKQTLQAPNPRITAREMRRAKLSMTLRTVIGLLTMGLIAAAANYYLGMGWFGEYAQLVLTSLMLLTLFAVGFAARTWREPEE